MSPQDGVDHFPAIVEEEFSPKGQGVTIDVESLDEPAPPVINKKRSSVLHEPKQPDIKI